MASNPSPDVQALLQFLSSDRHAAQALVSNDHFITWLAENENFANALLANNDFLQKLVTKKDFSDTLVDNTAFVDVLVDNDHFQTKLCHDMNFITQLFETVCENEESCEFVTDVLSTNEMFLAKLVTNNEFIRDICANPNFITAVSQIADARLNRVTAGNQTNGNPMFPSPVGPPTLKHAPGMNYQNQLFPNQSPPSVQFATMNTATTTHSDGGNPTPGTSMKRTLSSSQLKGSMKKVPRTSFGSAPSPARITRAVSKTVDELEKTFWQVILHWYNHYKNKKTDKVMNRLERIEFCTEIYRAIKNASRSKDKTSRHLALQNLEENIANKFFLNKKEMEVVNGTTNYWGVPGFAVNYVPKKYDFSKVMEMKYKTSP